ncbi:hypothetical protein [Calycomorphotria hydatis]|uniref:Uncharacterized protein n=1 Tax=Calycomorphotria hydatis TaxID=2528027 RepID=A0A517T5M3_9PLAN|nr:hypothetical protein [Calycomorphotria hydatis]QDT63651.1 hypothetical protein V22_08750 [Calycomorphotria hydatis]
MNFDLRNQYTPLGRVVVSLVIVLLCGRVASSEDVWSTKELLDAKNRWDLFIDAGKELTLEGRRSSMAPTLLKLRECPITFRPVDEEFRLSRAPDRVKVTGYLTKEKGEVEFRVRRLEPLPSDEEEYRRRRSSLKIDKVDGWYELADWAEGRGKFYDDPDMLELAREARLLAWKNERRDLATENAAARNPLIDKAKQFGFDDALIDELTHEMLWLEWQELKSFSGDKDDLQQQVDSLLKKVRGSLAGADLNLAPFPKELNKTYLFQPLKTYADADSKVRAKLSRLFVIDVERWRIESDAREDNSNGDEIAARIEKIIPERADLARRYRNRELDYRINNIANVTRAEAIQLSADLKEVGDPIRARKVLETWLASRVKLLRQDGVPGLVRAAEETIRLIDDKQASAKLLMEAFEIAPDSKQVAEQLTRLGYRKIGNRWLPPDADAAEVTDPKLAAMRSGVIDVGMSAAQVRGTLGSPDRIFRSISLSQVHEAWIYNTGGSRLVIHLTRYSQRPADEARVTGQHTVRE